MRLGLVLFALASSVALAGCLDPELTVSFRNRTQEIHHMEGTVLLDGEVLWAHEATVNATTVVYAPPFQAPSGTYTVVLVVDGAEHRDLFQVHNDRKSLEFIIGPNGPSITGAVL